MAKNYRLESARLDDAWDAFVGTSPDGTVFVTSRYLSNVGCRVGLYRCYNASEWRAIVAVVESPDGTSAILDDFVIYSGICFGAPTHNQGRAQRNSERFEIATFIACALAERYRRIEFALAPSVVDIRPFSWYNYGQAQDRYAIDVRYTTYLGISGFAGTPALEDIDVYHEATGARRQQVRYARRDNVTIDESSDIGLFLDFYRRTMERQGEVVAKPMLERMATLVSALLANGAARMFISRTSDGNTGSMAVYAFDSRRAYYLFGASDPSMRDSSTGTAVLWDAFGRLADSGVREIDLEGVNSPRRGWFKLSFGGELRPYYQVRMGGEK